MSRTHHKKGFTLVELSLAMAFLATLLITIAILVIRIISIYQSGLAIRAVSSTGRQLIDDFTRSISGSPIVNVVFDPSIDEAAAGHLSSNAQLTYKYYFRKTGEVTTDDGSGIRNWDGNTPLAGGFCTGLYSYLWNTGYALNDQDADSNFKGFTYTYPDPDTGDPITLSNFKLIRIPDDANRRLCTEWRKEEGGVRIDESKTNFKVPTDQKGDFTPVELLGSAEDELALYDFRVFPASSSRITGHVFYSATFILATLRGGVDIFTNANYCTAEYGTLNTDFNYCAINKFNFAMRATGETRGDKEYGQRGDR